MKKTIVIIALLLTTVVTGCAITPPVVARPGPVVDLDEVADLKQQTAMYAYEKEVMRHIRRRMQQSNGYPPYALATELSGTTEFEVTIYGGGVFDIKHLKTEGHDIFTGYGREAINYALWRTYLVDELENVNFRFRVTVAYRI